jgi:hypothetical protein
VKISEASVSAPLPGSTTTSQSATATCPKKTAAIGGGFSVANSGTDIVTPLASRPEGTRGWFVTGYNGAPNPHTVTSYAYCASVKVTGQSGSATLAGQSGSLATADAAPCPRTLAGGGFQFAQPSVGQQSWPAASLPVGASWRTIAFNSGGGGAATPISSYGACL